MPFQRRGLQDIRTVAGRSTSPGASHKSYIHLSVLEMERVRRQHEFETFQAKADTARQRVERLEADIASILGQMSDTPASQPTTPGTPPHDPGLVAVKHRYGVAPHQHSVHVPNDRPRTTGDEVSA